jgi:hypothetical protein
MFCVCTLDMPADVDSAAAAGSNCSVLLNLLNGYYRLGVSSLYRILIICVCSYDHGSWNSVLVCQF